MPGRRHGRSRAAVAYQSTIASPAAGAARRSGGGRGSWSRDPSVPQPGERRAEPVPSGARRLPFLRVWHPVGALPARVYWRRRLLVLALLLAVLGGGTGSGSPC